MIVVNPIKMITAPAQSKRLLRDDDVVERGLLWDEMTLIRHSYRLNGPQTALEFTRRC